MSMVTFEDKVQKLIDDWVLKCIMGDIEQFLQPQKGGNYPVAAILFSVIDLMGGLLNGNVEANHTDNMKTFMCKYLNQMDSKYGNLASLPESYPKTDGRQTKPPAQSLARPLRR